jgi:cytochrome bd-type quinol oxidase subunit 2
MNGAISEKEPIEGSVRRPASSWLLACGWILMLIALVLNATSAWVVYRAVTSKRPISFESLVLLLASPVALALAICCLLVPWLLRRPVGLRVALLLVLLGLGSILGWPMSCAGAAILTYDGPFVVP